VAKETKTKAKAESAVEAKAPAAGAVAVRETAQAPALLNSMLGDDDALDVRDLLVPRILLMQGLSKFVAEDKGKMGEFRDSLEAKLLGGKDKPLEFIPFSQNKTWVIFTNENGKLAYSSTVPFTPENQNWEREDTVKIDGKNVPIKRYACINYFVLLPSDIAAGEPFPLVISFRSTSYTAGRKLETHRAKYKSIKKPICWKTFNLTTSLQENDKGRFFVLDVAPERLTTDEELAEVQKWYQVIKSANVRIDESDADVVGGSGAEHTPTVDVNAADAQY